MRETRRSLRLYFIFFGGLVALGVLGALGSLHSMDAVFAIAPSAVFAVDFLYAGIRLPYLLEVSPKRLEQAVYTAMGMSALQGLLAFRGADPEAAGHALVQPLFGLLICWYLLANIRRLAREAIEKPKT